MRKVFALLCLAGMLALPLETAAGAEIVLPSGLKVIGDSAFRGDSSVISVVIPEGVESIGSFAFAESGLQTITFPASVTDIAPDAFSGCQNVLASVPAGSTAEQYVLSHREVFLTEEAGEPTGSADPIASNEDLQQRLNDLNCYSGFYSSRVDGKIGSGTRGALWFFEALYGLPLSTFSSGEPCWEDVNAATLEALALADATDFRGAGKAPTEQEILKAIDESSVIGENKKYACRKLTEMLLAEGKPPAFIIGALANVNHEGSFGRFEGTDNSGRYAYWDIINALGYYDTYSYCFVYKTTKDGEPITIDQLIADMERYHAAGGYFGIGCVQWTRGRGEKLIREHYYPLCSGGTITEEQVMEAEMAMFDCEINGAPGYDTSAAKAWPRWSSVCESCPDSLWAAVKAAQVFHDYVERSGMSQSTMSGRYRTAVGIYGEWFNP